MSKNRRDHLPKLQKSPVTPIQPSQTEEVKISVKLDKDEFYENEVINGVVVMKFAKDMQDFTLKLTLIYQEQFTLFDEEGQIVIANREFKKKLVRQSMDCPEMYNHGTEHHIMFGIKIPDNICNGTFYYSGEILNAKINYSIGAKLIEKQTRRQQENGETKLHKANTIFRLNNHIKSFNIQKVLYDETTVSRFMCFGGGTTNIEVEFLRDTFNVNKRQLQESKNQSNNRSYNNDSMRSNYALGLEDQPLDDNENSDNIIEIRYHIDNTKSTLKVVEVLVQLIQIVGVKGLDEESMDEQEDEAKNRLNSLELKEKIQERRVERHVQEVLFEKKYPGIYPKDQTDQPIPVKINLSTINKKIMKSQQKGGERYEKGLEDIEVKYSQGLQQTSNGFYLDNFYILRVKALINEDLFNSPFVDNQIFMCYHEVPIMDLSESQLKHIEGVQEQNLKDQYKQKNQGQVKINPNGLIIRDLGEHEPREFHHFHGVQDKIRTNIDEDIEANINQSEESKEDNKNVKINQVMIQEEDSSYNRV